MSFNAEIKILDPRIGKDEKYPLPACATDGSAGMDLRACIDEDLILKAGETKLVGTGFSIYLKDPNFVGMIYPRSGLGSKHGIILGNTTGVIDADYQGELLICLWNRTDKDFTIAVGERVAQYVVTPVIHPNYSIVEQFSNETERGEGGFGSSGKN